VAHFVFHVSFFHSFIHLQLNVELWASHDRLVRGDTMDEKRTEWTIAMALGLSGF
jgi:hypothetical protein